MNGTELKGKIGHVNKELEVSIKEYEALATFNYIATRCQEEDSYIIKFPLGIEKGRTFAYEMEKAYKVMEQSLTEKQDLERFTRLVVDKSFNFDRFRYALKHWDTIEEQLDVYNSGIGNVYKYTKEDFTFIKEMIKKYGK